VRKNRKDALKQGEKSSERETERKERRERERERRERERESRRGEKEKRPVHLIVRSRATSMH
jgi:hypothetical protein